jgi:AraC family transcriptional regulator
LALLHKYRNYRKNSIKKEKVPIMNLPLETSTQNVPEGGFVFFDSGCRRDNTSALRGRAIERVIAIMYEHFMEPLSLQDFADIAQLSPFHFNRVFKSMTGIQPSVFLASIRLQEAKKLLLTTELSITDICFDVGYRSLGTFTSRFTQFVGIAPTRLRQLAKDPIMQAHPRDLLALYHRSYPQLLPDATPTGITGTIEVMPPFHGIIFVGAFADPLPHGQPIGCDVLTAPGDFCISSLPDGEYYLFAAALEETHNLLSLLHGEVCQHGSLGKSAIAVHNNSVKGQPTIHLAPTQQVNPPLLIALPWLLISSYLQQNRPTAFGADDLQLVSTIHQKEIRRE